MKYSKIKSINKCGEQSTYDITVENDHCFFGNNILVHNCGYRGEIMIHLLNLGEECVIISKGEAIAQLLLVPCWMGVPEVVEDLDSTERGSGGFGSTGLKISEKV